MSRSQVLGQVEVPDSVGRVGFLPETTTVRSLILPVFTVTIADHGTVTTELRDESRPLPYSVRYIVLFPSRERNTFVHVDEVVENTPGPYNKQPLVGW